ncbi:MAG: TM0106 family RecB-like putative nuclease, partial [Candidatus Aureabacteria bacterium]|nr:TM0106 family RecB-like putative nuclease [Candidatus Auribacterota bacterium]
MTGTITASMLYNLVQCPRRFTLDLFGDPRKKDPVSPFVQLLWEKGNAYEEEVIRGLKIPFTNLRFQDEGERERLTLEAIARGDELIYGGRVSAGDLLGEPDLLRKKGRGYVAGDIKSGAGFEGESDESEGRPKEHYAVQLALYTDILDQRGLSSGRIPFIWDVHGEEVPYDLDTEIRKKQTLWDAYQNALNVARALAANKANSTPALTSICKLCHWRTVCTQQMEKEDDLTLIPELGRSRRNALLAHVRSVGDLAKMDIDRLMVGKKTAIQGIGPDTLRKFKARAVLQKTPGAMPYLKQPLSLPSSECEIFFDIETDPMRDICYLHGFLERAGGKDRYSAFLAEKPTMEEEERAFKEAWQFIKANRPCVIYYYSHYERTFWRKLQKKYPTVLLEAEVAELFDPKNSIDLYGGVVRPWTEWPTRDLSLKTLAKFLGF